MGHEVRREPGYTNEKLESILNLSVDVANGRLHVILGVFHGLYVFVREGRRGLDKVGKEGKVAGLV